MKPDGSKPRTELKYIEAAHPAHATKKRGTCQFPPGAGSNPLPAQSPMFPAGLLVGKGGSPGVWPLPYGLDPPISRLCPRWEFSVLSSAVVCPSGKVPDRAGFQQWGAWPQDLVGPTPVCPPPPRCKSSEIVGMSTGPLCPRSSPIPHEHGSCPARICPTHLTPHGGMGQAPPGPCAPHRAVNRHFAPRG